LITSRVPGTLRLLSAAARCLAACREVLDARSRSASAVEVGEQRRLHRPIRKAQRKAELLRVYLDR
jgi:hypothetical protein